MTRSIADAATTVRDYRPRVDQLCPPRSRNTYNTGFDRLVAAHGDQALHEIRTTDLQLLRDTTARTVGERTVARARTTGRRLRSYDPRAHGYGAAENFVRSCRFFFRCAVDDGLLTSSPAAKVAVPRRPPAPERALTESELAEIYTIATTSGNDPELDGLLLQFLRETAARRGGALTLVLGALDRTRQCATLSEKGGRTHDVPCGQQLIDQLIRFATSRGARAEADMVFRYLDGSPLTRRRFNSLFDRIDRYTNWSERLDVGAHWIRHTTLTDIAMATDIRVAAGYAGHVEGTGSMTYRYTKPSFEELLAAHDLVFGAGDRPQRDRPEHPGTRGPAREHREWIDPAPDDASEVGR